MTDYKKQTRAIHSGHDSSETQNTCAVPIYQTTAYKFNNTQHAADVFELKVPGFIYTRLNNPTNDILEKRLAAVEGGVGAAVFASGISAISTTLLTLLKTDDHIVASSSLYGGTYNLLNVTLPRFGIETDFVDADHVVNFENAIKENTRVIYIESLGNPKLDVLDIEAIAQVAQKYQVPLIVDNTIASPSLLNPIEYGANIVIHSLTKYIEGHGRTLGGVVIDAGNFNWANGKFPEFTEPSKGYHGVVYNDAFAEAAFIVKIRIEGLRDLGGCISPYNAFQIIQGLQTLDVRIKKQSENALAVAKWLEKSEQVAWVNYPGLKSSKYYHLTKKYLPEGQSGIVTFGLKGGYKAAQKATDSVKLFSLLANIGDSKSLIIHPASTTHQQLTEEQQATTGVTSDLIRLSIGIEAIEDIIADLEQAINCL